ncbi:arabinosaccharide transport system permease protein [Planifilum fulgidum]|jgi:arabinosaccharide transport system permease protein|uniref:Arabinosaccharide transport system permease protein n=2 Tax=Planifilum fulgidum TaxID=201973 RepID=A0A1I2MHB9_9BACL|nr:arabinosaccharide transport system permease protein [Planifilum fulgidum]
MFIAAAERRVMFRIFAAILLTGLSFVALFPFVALLLASFKSASELMRFGLNLRLDFDVLSLKNYLYLFTEQGKIYWTWYKNSLLITLLFTAVSLFFSSLVGYALAVYNFKGKNTVLFLVLFLMMIPLEILMLPLFEEMIAFRLVDTYWGVIVPFAVSPFAVFFFRQYAVSLPRELLDAARIDGCSEFGIYLRIMSPLMIPAFGAMGILQALHSWNNFLWPLVVLRTDEMFTLPIGLAGLLTPYGNNYDVLISGAVLTVVPIIILFFLFQRYFISGLTIGAVKE